MEEMMREENPAPTQESVQTSEHVQAGRKASRPEITVVRNWKEYLGESLLIIFSVVLALILTEVFNKMHDDQQTKQVLHQLREELISNKKAEQEQYQYHLMVLKNIDSALRNPGFAQKFIKDGEIDLKQIAPEGVSRRDLNDVAWQVAKQYDIFSKIDLTTFSLLNDIYNNQERITKSEGEIAKVLLSWESRKPENLRTTLILVRDNYHAWAVDRASNILNLYQQAIDKLSNY